MDREIDFQSDEDDVVEKYGLPSASEQSTLYRWVLLLIEGCLKIKSSKLVHENYDESLPENTLHHSDAIDDPPNLWKGLPIVDYIWRSKLTRFLCCILLAYISVKYFILILLRSKHDRMANQWIPKVREGANRTSKCALKSDVKDWNYQDTFDREQKFLKWINDPMIAIKGCPIVYYQYMAVSPIIYSFVFILNVRELNLRLDSIGFLINPIAERRRVQGILKNIITSTENLIRSNHDEEHQKIRFPYLYQARSKVIPLMQLMKRISTHNLVKPSNLGDYWHRKLTTITALTLISNLIALYCSTFFGFIAFIAIECYVRTNYRLDLIDCQRWNENATIVKDIIQLESISDIDDLLYYENYDGSFLGFIYLMLFVEPRYLESFNNIYMFVEFYVTVCFLPPMIAIENAMVIIGSLDKIRWISQINRQLEQCKSLLFDLRAQKSQQVNDSNKREILAEKSLVAYLNYRLYMSQHHRYKMYMKGLAERGFVMVSSSCVLINITTRFVGCNLSRQVNLIACLNFVAYAVLPCCAAYLVSIASRITAKINCLLSYRVHCDEEREGSGDLIAILELWRPHLLDKLATNRVFATTLFGAQLTFVTLMTIFFNLAGLWFLWR